MKTMCYIQVILKQVTTILYILHLTSIKLLYTLLFNKTAIIIEDLVINRLGFAHKHAILSDIM